MENKLWLHKGKKFQRSGPDGLEAWGVAIAAAFINFIMAGINRSSGILYVEFIETFQVDRMKASLPFTIRSVSRNLLGPVVGIFGQKYGVRPVILVGGVIGTLSTIACFFATDIFWTSVFWGFCNGIGAALIMTLTQAAIGQHFIKHISTASGLGLSGGCFGSFVFPAMFESLLEEYRIQGTFLFIAGMIMHVIPAAIIMKKPTWLKNRPKKGSGTTVNGSINSLGIAVESKYPVTKRSKSEDKADLLEKNGAVFYETCLNGNNNWFGGNDLPLIFRKNIDTDLLWANREMLVCLLTENNALKFPPPEVWQTENVYGDSQVKEAVNIFCKIAKDIYCLSPEINGSIQFNATTYNSIGEKFASGNKNMLHANGQLIQTVEFNVNTTACLRDLLEKFFERDKDEVIKLFSQDEHEDLYKTVHELKHMYILLESNKCHEYSCSNFDNSQLIFRDLSSLQSIDEPSNTFYSHIKAAIWLHVNPLFIQTCLCRCVHFITFQPILTTVVDFSRDKGLPEEYGKYAIAAIAIGDLIGRLLLGWITDRKYLTLPRYMFIFMVLQGLSTMSIALTNSAGSLLPILTIYGLLQGCTFIQHPVLISHYMGKNEQSIALGCLNFFPGIIGFAMPFYIGYFRDSVGSYNGMFYINGCIGCFIGFLWLTEPYLLKCSRLFPHRTQQTLV